MKRSRLLRVLTLVTMMIVAVFAMAHHADAVDTITPVETTGEQVVQMTHQEIDAATKGEATLVEFVIDGNIKAAETKLLTEPEIVNKIGEATISALTHDDATLGETQFGEINETKLLTVRACAKENENVETAPENVVTAKHEEHDTATDGERFKKEDQLAATEENNALTDHDRTVTALQAKHDVEPDRGKTECIETSLTKNTRGNDDATLKKIEDASCLVEINNNTATLGPNVAQTFVAIAAEQMDTFNLLIDVIDAESGLVAETKRGTATFLLLSGAIGQENNDAYIAADQETHPAPIEGMVPEKISTGKLLAATTTPTATETGRLMKDNADVQVVGL